MGAVLLAMALGLALFSTPQDQTGWKLSSSLQEKQREKSGGMSAFRFLTSRRIAAFFLFLLLPFMMALSYREYFFPLYASERGLMGLYIGPPLATMEGLRFRENETALSNGDALFIYTDGVTEATSGALELFGEKRMVEALNRHATETPEEIIVGVRKSIDGFVKDAPQFDDITMLCMRYKREA